MAAYDALHQSRMTEVIQPPFLSVALSGRIEKRKVARPSVTRTEFLFGRQELLLDGNGYPFGKGDAHKASGRYCIAIANQAHGIGGGDEFVPLRRTRGGQRGYRVGLRRSGQRIGRHSNSPLRVMKACLAARLEASCPSAPSSPNQCPAPRR